MDIEEIIKKTINDLNKIERISLGGKENDN